MVYQQRLFRIRPFMNDSCIGKILDAVEARSDADNTLICFFSDHGEMMGDHGGWQKETFFEQSVKILFLLSWPGKLQADIQRKELVSLTDLFGIATAAVGAAEVRDGVDILDGEEREALFGTYGRPESNQFKMMVRKGNWKYIYIKNGGREQLFDLAADPQELYDLAKAKEDMTTELRNLLIGKCVSESGLACAAQNGRMAYVKYAPRKYERLHQFDFSKQILNYTIPSGCEYMSQALNLEEIHKI